MFDRQKSGDNLRIVKGAVSYVLEIAEVVIIVFALTWFAKTYVFGSVTVGDNSMLPTLNQGTQVFVYKFFKGEALERGDVIVFSADKEYPSVKRVIGLAGDRIEIRNGYVYVNQKPFFEPGIKTPVEIEFPAVTVPAGHVFVLSDDRRDERDSRTWGTIPYERVIGKAGFSYWPWPRLSFL